MRVFDLFAVSFVAELSFASAISRHSLPWATNLRAPLKFLPDGTFQIAIFNDLHFGENVWDQWGPQQDINTVAVLNKVLDAESPQLVVLNGDLITGTNAYLLNGSVKIDQMVAPFAERNLTWASTYGNHYSAFNLSRLNIFFRERLYSNARTSPMVFGADCGAENESDLEQHSPKFSTWCLVSFRSELDRLYPSTSTS